MLQAFAPLEIFAGQVFVGTCLHTKGDDIAVKFAAPQQPPVVGKRQLPPMRGNGTLSAVKNHAENEKRRLLEGEKEGP